MRRLLLPLLLFSLLLPSPASAHGPGGHDDLPPLPSGPASGPASEEEDGLPLLPFLLAAPLAGVAVSLLASRLMPGSGRAASPASGGDRVAGKAASPPASAAEPAEDPAG